MNTATTPAQDAAASSCLPVIDVQQSFTRRADFTDEGRADFLATQNALIDGARARGVPVVRVLYASPQGDATDPFAPATGLMRPLDGLSDFDAALTVRKCRHSALAGTGLDVWRAVGADEAWDHGTDA
jgi:nicotinamidase-related amidase